MRTRFNAESRPPHRHFFQFKANRWRLMARLVTVTILLVGLQGVPAEAGKKKDYDLRRLRWGMDQEQILKAEKARLAYQDRNYLVYSTKVLDRQVALEFHMGRNQLYRAVYRLAEHYIMEANYLKDYNDFKTILTKKFGAADKDEMKWRKPHLKGDPSQWGVAVSIGDLSCQTVWETPRTRVVLQLTGGNYEVTCTIDYLSKDLAHLAKAAHSDEENPETGGKSNKQLEKALEDF